MTGGLLNNIFLVVIVLVDMFILMNVNQYYTI
jgi:hypothetical protein